MAFITENKDADVTAWITQFRQALRRQAILLRSQENAQGWVDDFTKLKVKYGAEVVGLVLYWYCNHLDEPLVPAAYSAAAFRQKFDRIQKCMVSNSDGPVEPINLLWQVAADRILNANKLPVEIACQLPLIMQRSSKNWNDFSVRLMVARRQCVEDIWKIAKGTDPVLRKRLTDEQMFLREVIYDYSADFTASWTLLIVRRFGYLDNYTGSPLLLAFTPDSSIFLMSFWHVWSERWCLNPSKFDGLLRRLLKRDEA